MSQVSDYNIANASGASVRSDLNAVFDAIKTLNSGGTDPSNPEAFMPYVDTADNNNLKIRNSANNGFTTIGPVNSANLGLLPRAGGTMTGQLFGDDSSGASTPAYAFDNDPDTGMFRVGANDLGFSTAGTQRVGLTNNGLHLLNDLPLRLCLTGNITPHVELKPPSSMSGNLTLTLPSSITSGGFLQTDGSGNLSFSIVQGVPSGSVFCMAVATVPSGYLECNGDTVSRTTYAALFAVIGTQYGSTNSGNFKVPDLRGEFVRGFDNGRGADSGRSIASSQGASNASHNHSISLSGNTSTRSLTGAVTKISEGFNAVGTASGVFSKTNDGNSPITESASTSPVSGFTFDGSHNHTFSASGTSGNQGGEARPRNIAMMYIIKG